ncbi:YceK/YidQ family lipoprotein [Pseudomonas sp.]|uniref:YceK/YidQ family lipoprotein n=1 Tax=Pseudomonas sp. TaxID=306 RepID=UPI0028AA034B|nr:YceK/YidQ family lipoprotein [Pseudomonas sp.]
MNKLWIGAAFTAALSGCGTIETVSDESKAVDKLAHWGSDCHSIPRAYSGLMYQFCTLNGPARSGSHWSAETVFVDMGLSAVADTVILPYTGYQQLRKGSVPIRRLEY